jgi:hypothetical protein
MSFWKNHFQRELVGMMVIPYLVVFLALTVFAARSTSPIDRVFASVAGIIASVAVNYYVKQSWYAIGFSLVVTAVLLKVIPLFLTGLASNDVLAEVILAMPACLLVTWGFGICRRKKTPPLKVGAK